MRNFDVTSWFWTVGNDQTQAWSSEDARFLPIEDPKVTAFLAGGNAPSRIGSITDLAHVFSQQFPAGMLNTYANARQWSKATGGYLATIDGNVVVFPTTVESMCFISGKVQRLQQADAPASVNWQVDAMTIIEIDTVDFIKLATEIADFFQGTFDTLKAVFADIEGGAITTIAEIDQRFA